MGESTGHIVFINSHDYLSDVTGAPASGCLATLRAVDGTEVMLYTGSLRLQHTLEMLYAARSEVTVDYFDADASVNEQQRLVGTADAREPSAFSGPFNLKAVWTRE
jgi:hypothetical protein